MYLPTFKIFSMYTYFIKKKKQHYFRLQIKIKTHLWAVSQPFKFGVYEKNICFNVGILSATLVSNNLVLRIIP